MTPIRTPGGRTPLIRQRKRRRNPRRCLKLHKPVRISIIPEGSVPTGNLAGECLLAVGVTREVEAAEGHDEDAVVVGDEPGDALGVVVVDEVDCEAGGGEVEEAEESKEERGEWGEFELHFGG